MLRRRASCGYSSSSEPSASRDAGRDDADVAQFDVDRLLAFLVADVRVDRLLLVDDPLHSSVEEGVERAVVVFGDPFLREIFTRNLSSVVAV